MAPDYRVVVRHVRYWRGTIHKWSTTYPFVNQPSSALTESDAMSVALADDSMCYGGGSQGGGTWGCDIYKVGQKGSPIVSYRRFDPENPSEWIEYAGGSWTTTTTNFLPVAEPALVAEWPVGLSVSGKPVTLKKWYHAVPLPLEVGEGVDVAPSDVTSLQVGATRLTGILSSKGLALGSSASRLAGTPRILSHYGAHQMPKGRKRKKMTVVIQSGDPVVG